MNSVAGGGTLLTFPALFAVFGPLGPQQAASFANGTSTVALMPGSIAKLAACCGPNGPNTANSAGTVSSVPPPATEFITPAKNADTQSAAKFQSKGGIRT